MYFLRKDVFRAGDAGVDGGISPERWLLQLNTWLRRWVVGG